MNLTFVKVQAECLNPEFDLLVGLSLSMINGMDMEQRRNTNFRLLSENKDLTSI